jgi:histidinol-phosphate/aromatic aminotransferase/cobyric acid decarboxylase-like protein
VVPTRANFLYLETPDDPTQLAHRIQNEGCIVRSLVPWSIKNGLRITIGTPEQNRILVESLVRVLRTASVR